MHLIDLSIVKQWITHPTATAEHTAMVRGPVTGTTEA